MIEKPVEIVDTWEDWEAQYAQPQDNPARYRRVTGRPPESWSNFDGMEFRVAMIRAPNYTPSSRIQITTSDQAYRFMRSTLQDEVVESFYVMVLDGKHRVLGINQVARGGQVSVEVHPANVLRPVLVASGVAFIVFHNHPSGDPEPSREDELLTSRLQQAGELMGLPILDHIIVAPGRYVSMSDRGML
jgi:DNA repair protein RadC